MLDAVELTELTRHVCLLAVAVICAYTDLARGKLYNVVTLGGIVLGFGLCYLLDAASPGYPHLIAAVVAVSVGAGVLFLLYLAGGMGAGDVKLMAAVGALAANWGFVLLALMYAALIGAVIAIGILIWQRRLSQGLKDSVRTFFTFRARPREGSQAAYVPYGLAIAVGTVLVWLERFAL